MDKSWPKNTQLHVPNWLITLEIIFGATLLYISSHALLETDRYTQQSGFSEGPRNSQPSQVSTDADTFLIAASVPTEKY